MALLRMGSDMSASTSCHESAAAAAAASPATRASRSSTTSASSACSRLQPSTAPREPRSLPEIIPFEFHRAVAQIPAKECVSGSHRVQNASSGFAGDARQQVLHHVHQQRMQHAPAVHHAAPAGALTTDAYQGF